MGCPGLKGKPSFYHMVQPWAAAPPAQRGWCTPQARPVSAAAVAPATPSALRRPNRGICPLHWDGASPDIAIVPLVEHHCPKGRPVWGKITSFRYTALLGLFCCLCWRGVLPVLSFRIAHVAEKTRTVPDPGLPRLSVSLHVVPTVGSGTHLHCDSQWCKWMEKLKATGEWW